MKLVELVFKINLLSTMAKNKNKLTSVQKDLMIGLTSSLMFYIISELAKLTEKLEDIID